MAKDARQTTIEGIDPPERKRKKPVPLDEQFEDACFELGLDPPAELRRLKRSVIRRAKRAANADEGVYNPNNKLNDLTGKQWIKFSKSWFVHSPPRRRSKEILHPAKYPETLVREFIEFFTKRGQWVLDPFLGTGSTLVAAGQAGRNGVGVELMEKYAAIARERVAAYTDTGPDAGPDTDADDDALRLEVVRGDSLELGAHLRSRGIEEVDYCITSPPYWNQLKRRSMRQRERVEAGLDTQYSKDNAADLGNEDDYFAFLAAMRAVFDAVYDVMRPGGYLTIITNNVYADSQLYPLAFDTVRALTQDWDDDTGRWRIRDGSWVAKDERIWLQDDKRLLALGINYAWVGNRHHQYCLIFRKEE